MSCGVFAAVTNDPGAWPGQLAPTFLRCSDRGRDSWGLEVLDRDGQRLRISAVGRDEGPPTDLPLGGPSTLVGLWRAEPTTEWVRDKSDNDVQPFRSERWVYAHNGTISNDKELIARYGLDPDSRIDSAVIGPLLDRFGFDESIHLLEGSFAIVAVDRRRPELIHFACNYKPLWCKGSADGRTIQFASQESYLTAGQGFDPLRDPAPFEIPPYSIGSATVDKISWDSLYRPDPGPRRVLVVCSGGLDSGTVAWKQHTAGDEVTLIHFLHGARGEEREARAVRSLANAMGLPPERVVFVTTDFFRSHVTSALTDPNGVVTTVRGGEAGAEFGHEWVPARNLIFLALALGYAEKQGIHHIALGNNLEESGGGYPDNEQQFINWLQRVAPYALRPYHQITLLQPLGTLMKHEIVGLGLSLDMPFELTWSCYQDGDAPCGECGPCFMRRRAFEMNTVDQR